MNLPTIIIDTREQLPYTFDPERANVIHRKLPAGDYSLDGMENEMAVERKSLNDFVSTVTRGRKRFSKELKLLQTYEAACIVLESSMRDILMQKYDSHAHPKSIFGSLVSIIIDYGIPVFCCTNRQVACQFVEGYLLRFYHRKVKENVE